MEVEKIECPSCGSNSTFKVSGDEYRCNYCQSNFKVRADKDPLEDFQATINKIKTQYGGRSAEEIRATQKRGRKLGIAVMSIVFAVIGGIVAIAMITSTTRTTISKAFKLSGIWGDPKVDNYQCFLGSKGPVIFLMMQQEHGMDSVRYFVQMVDPQTKKVLSTHPFGPAMKWKDLFHFSDKIESRFDCVANDIAYNTPRDSGLIGFDIYTFREVVTSSTLPKKFPELSSGISKASFGYGKNTFRIKTNTAEEFLFDAGSNTLRPRDRKHDKPKDTLVDQLYLSRGNRPQLFFMNWRTKTNDNDMRLSEDFENDYSKNKSWYRSSYQIKDFKKVSDNVYFMAKVIGRYKNGLLILYTQDLSKTSPVMLEFVDADGKAVWQNKNPLLQSLKKSGGSSSELYCDYQLNDQLCVFTIETKGRHSFGVDLSNGNTLWTYDAP